MIWRERRLLLIVLGVLLAANAAFFFTYRVQYQSRLQSLEDRKAQAEAELTTARSSRLAAEGKVASYRQVQHDIDELYAKNWSTEQERLTAFIGEVNRLAVASNLIPKTTSYNRAARQRQSAGAETVTINFTVQGTYEQVRRLINLLELSRQFVIIDQISLTSSDAQTLTLTLQLKTLFRDTSPAGPGASS